MIVDKYLNKVITTRDASSRVQPLTYFYDALANALADNAHHIILHQPFFLNSTMA